MRYFTLAILLVSLSGFSQTISKQVIGPAGATYENDTNKLSYTAGEVLVEVYQPVVDAIALAILFSGVVVPS